jgi:hypothetical protein
MHDWAEVVGWLLTLFRNSLSRVGGAGGNIRSAIFDFGTQVGLRKCGFISVEGKRATTSAGDWCSPIFKSSIRTFLKPRANDWRRSH